MDHQNYMQQQPGPTMSPGLQQQQPGQQPGAPQQQPQTRAKGRRQYAAQQYDFNAPAAPSMFDQQQQFGQQQYPPQQNAYQQYGQPAPVGVPPAQPGQPQGYPQQPGYAYGQEYQQTPPQYAGYQTQPGVGGITNQMQGMHIGQVRDPLGSVLMNLAYYHESPAFGRSHEYPC